jgi:hypothetical protein
MKRKSSNSGGKKKMAKPTRTLNKGRISIYLNYSILALDVLTILYFTVRGASDALLDSPFTFVLLKAASYIAVAALIAVMIERVTNKISNNIFAIRIVSTFFLLLMMTLAFGIARVITSVLGF